MVYDPVRRQIVLFGGLAASGPRENPWVVLGDTWIWNGSSWRKISDGGPEARYAHAMAFDRARGVVVLYGGATMTAAGETRHLEDMWQWDGDRWTEIRLSGSPPGKRYSPGMAFDSARGRMVLYGGLEVKTRNEVVTFDDVWEWDGVRWERIP